ncbi:unnamed protein product [Lupinus luteus]|uniref:Uncharacterized protein n=1 Tax=Lupinus luteus TaxID=3873 RepID=A0AAV1XH24_LUPLU
MDAAKNGVAQETMQNAVLRGSKIMTEKEAQQILGVTKETPWEEIVKDNISRTTYPYQREQCIT